LLINTPFGLFDGSSWDQMCRLVFARKYQGFQAMPASPGDYGIEGYTKPDGWAFQCYCPEKHYTQIELHEHLRDKLTTDVRKLKDNAALLPKFLGTTVLTRWIFVTPEIGNHSLLAHAQKKETELRGWKLSFVDANITVEVQDGAFYAQEIYQIRNEAGEKPALSGVPLVLPPLDQRRSVYEAHILRKSRLRLSASSAADDETRVAALYSKTLPDFLECDEHFRRIESYAPKVHQRLVRLVNEFEEAVAESCIFLQDTPEALTRSIRKDLETRLIAELERSFDGADILALTRRVVARWLATCTLDYE
jgi:hypothetical protein